MAHYFYCLTHVSRLLQVATLRYLRAKTCIPVPEVFHFEQSASVIGAEYMLMEKVSKRDGLSPNPT